MNGQKTHETVAARLFRTLAITAYVLLASVLLLLFIIRGNSAIGWLISAPIMGISVALQATVVKKGCVTGFILYLVTAAILLGIFLLTSPR
jgi:hypothetical protein